MLSKNTVMYSIFRHISTKNLKNFVECRSILAYNVENLCCFLAKKNVVAFCRKILAKNLAELCRKILSKNLAEQCRKILAKKAVV